MLPYTETVTARVPEATFGAVVLAVMVVEPLATPCTLALMLLVPVVIVPLAGVTVATAVLLDVKVKGSPPAGAGAERSRVKLWSPPAPTVTDWIEKLRVSETVTGSLVPA
jgi:hypothetical protein